MLGRLIAATALMTAALAAPAAATVTISPPLKPCYVSDGEADAQREMIIARATGFTPGATVDLSIDGDVKATGTADVDGVAVAAVPAPFQGVGERAFTLVVAERGNPANFVTTAPLVTNLTVTLHPNTARPSRRVRFKGRGFTNAAPIYAHYLFRGKLKRTVMLARRPTGSCGRFSVKRQQIPVDRVRTGRWTLQVDQQPEWSKTPASNMQRLTITVRKKFREP